jgi:hypothetical protein
MSWSERYKKQGIKKAKEVNFSNIASIAKLTVPPTAVSTFEKKVAAATQPFDVIVEEDSAAGKGRIVVKKVTPADIIIEFEVRTGAAPDAAKNLMKVKTELTSLAMTNSNYLKKLNAVKDSVKKLKEELKGLESVGPMADPLLLKNDLNSLRQQLTQADAAGKAIQTEHNSWYLNGPRSGIAPILTKFGVDAKTVSAADADLFGKAVHAMSAEANEVRKVYDVDVANATEALLARISNLEAVTTKGHGDALKSVRTTLAAEVEKVKEMVDKSFFELKLVKTQELMAQMKDPNSQAYKRFVAFPNSIQAEKESNKTRLGNIPKYLETVTKQVSRLKKGVPEFYAGDVEVRKLIATLDGLEERNIKSLAEGKATIEKCDRELDQFGKPPARPATATPPARS